MSGGQKKAIIFTWVFNTTGGSLLIIALLHAAGNVWEPFVAVPGTVTPVYRMFGAVGACDQPADRVRLCTSAPHASSPSIVNAARRNNAPAGIRRQPIT